MSDPTVQQIFSQFFLKKIIFHEEKCILLFPSFLMYIFFRCQINNIQMSVAGKRLVINSNKKLVGKSSATPTPPKPPSSLGPKSDQDDSIKDRLQKEAQYYRQRSQESLIKVKFLYDKLQGYGSLEGVPERIKKQISQTDTKIKFLEEKLFFKKSKNLQKLQERVLNFLIMLEFDISLEDMKKIGDEIEIVLFLLDIFEQKYRQLMSEREEVDMLTENLRKNTFIDQQDSVNYINELRVQNARLNEYVREVQVENLNLKRGNHESRAFQSGFRSNNRLYQQSIKQLEEDNRSLEIKCHELEKQNRSTELQISSFRGKNEELLSVLNDWKKKYRKLEEEIHKMERDDIRWKQRYSVMEKQKDERIQLLQQQLQLFHSDLDVEKKKVNTFSMGQHGNKEQYYDLS